jgi:hypothetical protein
MRTLYGVHPHNKLWGDYSFHPVEPLSVRFTLSMTLNMTFWPQAARGNGLATAVQ